LQSQDLKKKPKLREKFQVLDEWVLPYEVVPIIDIPGASSICLPVLFPVGTWAHTHTHAHMHTHTHACTHTRTHVQMHTRTHAHTQ